MHSSAALPMAALPEENRAVALRSAPRSAATISGPSFGEWMLRRAAPAVAGTVPQTASPAVTPDNWQTEMNLAQERTTATNRSDVSQTISTRVQSPKGSAPTAEELSDPGAETSSRLPNAVEAPSAPAPARAYITARAQTTIPQRLVRASTALLAKDQKATSRKATSAPAPQEGATESEAAAAPNPVSDAKIVAAPTDSDGARNDAIPAPVPESHTSLAVQATHAAATAIRTSKLEIDPALKASSTTEAAATGPRDGRNVATAEAKGNSADPAPGTVDDPPHAVRASRGAQAESPRSASGTSSSSLIASTKSAAFIAQSVSPQSPGCAPAGSSVPHILRSNIVSSAPPPPAGAPATVSAAFTRMDSAAPPQVLQSAPQRLSVGVRDSGLGWVEIRTRTAAGQVSAVLATPSGVAHAALQAQMPELRDFLAGQQVRVDQLASERFSFSRGSGEAAPQQEDCSAPSRDPDASGEAPPLVPAFGEGAEEGLSYINVRV
jgi:hypothetical protein